MRLLAFGPGLLFPFGVHSSLVQGLLDCVNQLFTGSLENHVDPVIVGIILQVAENPSDLERCVYHAEELVVVVQL